jgi:hypothetical protein
MIYCIANCISYSSNLNVFAVVAGLFLIRGHLGAVRYVTWFTAFFLSAMSLSLVTIVPWVQPMEYRLLLMRMHPLSSALSVLFLFGLFCMLIWVYRQLRLPAVVAARVSAGQKASTPVLAFALGISLSVILGVTLQLILKGSDADEAMRRAKVKVGADYKYFVSGINFSGNRVSAQLVAYKDDEIKGIEVEWDK